MAGCLGFSAGVSFRKLQRDGPNVAVSSRWIGRVFSPRDVASGRTEINEHILSAATCKL